jgi:glutathione S-transferase
MGTCCASEQQGPTE